MTDSAKATYASAGVSIAAGDEAEEKLKPWAAKAHRPGGEVPKYTYMEPVIMNHKGEVLHRMFHPH